MIHFQIGKWKYTDYVRIGSPDSPKQVFQTLRKLNENGSDTTEEMHYQFDSAGRLTHAAFMQTPDSSGGYGSGHPAAYRAHSYYVYDPSGRILDLQHAFQAWNSGTSKYDDTLIKRYRYATSGGSPYYDDGGLRTQVDIMGPGSSNSWTLERSELYGYDSSLDYLTSVDYNDGLSNEYTIWGYDAAGNRSSDSAQSGSWSYDALNRMTASPNKVYENDVLGNRTWRNRYVNSGGVRYTWDYINRMLTCCNANDGATYMYRADGMRVKKVNGLTLAWHVDDEQTGSGHYDTNQAINKDTTRFYYDGQMAMEEDYTYTTINGVQLDVTRYGLGARGIDFMEKFHSGSSTAVMFPLYDGHGNMISTVARSGSGNSSFTVSNSRTYDVWGGIRSGNTGGDPAQRYCASLGHRVDDESEGLIYMRARYFEPWTGRFTSEDPARQGANWFVYCGSDPVNRADATGKFWHLLISFVIGFTLGALSANYAGNNWFIGGLIGGLSAVAGTLTANPWAAAGVSGFLSSVMLDLANTGTVDWKKAIYSTLAAVGTGGLGGHIYAKVGSSLLGSKFSSIGGEGLSDPVQEWGDEIASAAWGLFGQGCYDIIR
ncbi:MAG: RHS repeat-associated core domain-containing protein [Fimbriimonadales bacterium]